MIIIASMDKIATKKKSTSTPGCKHLESLLFLA